MLPGKLNGGNFVALIKAWRDMWNSQVLDHLLASRIVAGSGITVQRLPAGTVISAIRRSGGGGAAAVIHDDAGPFAVTIEIKDGSTPEQTEYEVVLHNTASESGIAGLVTVGSYREEIEDQQWRPQEGVVYLDITWDDDTEDYTVIFELESGLPDTADEKRYILRIAEITYDSETDTWSAAQIRPPGDIEVLNRWVT